METNLWGFLRDRARLLGWEFVACVIPGAFLLAAGVPSKPLLISVFLGSALVSWLIDPVVLLVKTREPKPDPLKRLALASSTQSDRRIRSNRRIKWIWLPILVATSLTYMVYTGWKIHSRLAAAEQEAAMAKWRVSAQPSASVQPPAQPSASVQPPTQPSASVQPSPGMAMWVHDPQDLVPEGKLPKLIIRAEPGAPEDLLYRVIRKNMEASGKNLGEWKIKLSVETLQKSSNSCKLAAYGGARRNDLLITIGPYYSSAVDCDKAANELGREVAFESVVRLYSRDLNLNPVGWGN